MFAVPLPEFCIPYIPIPMLWCDYGSIFGMLTISTLLSHMVAIGASRRGYAFCHQLATITKKRHGELVLFWPTVAVGSWSDERRNPGHIMLPGYKGKLPTVQVSSESSDSPHTRKTLRLRNGIVVVDCWQNSSRIDNQVVLVGRLLPENRPCTLSAKVGVNVGWERRVKKVYSGSRRKNGDKG